MRSPQIQQLSQRVIASYHLGPMDRKETQAYIEHRLKHVGWQGNPSFDGAAFDEIHASSGGIPRRINLLATGSCSRRISGSGTRSARGTSRRSPGKCGRSSGPSLLHAALAPVGRVDKPASLLPVPARRGAPRLRRCPGKARRARRTAGATRLFDREPHAQAARTRAAWQVLAAIADGKAARRAGPGPLRSGRAAQLHEDGAAARGVLARARVAACGAGAHRSALRPGSERPAIRRSATASAGPEPGGGVRLACGTDGGDHAPLRAGPRPERAVRGGGRRRRELHARLQPGRGQEGCAGGSCRGRAAQLRPVDAGGAESRPHRSDRRPALHDGALGGVESRARGDFRGAHRVRGQRDDRRLARQPAASDPARRNAGAGRLRPRP